jgi:hypothetical protein
MLAIDRDARVFYEGSARVGIPIWPSPVVTVATVLRSDADRSEIAAQVDLGLARLVFREDYFDPVTRIRRGRFYNRSDGGQPHSWQVQVHPALPSDSRSIGQGGLITRELFGFHGWAARIHLRGDGGRSTIALGIQDAFTRWRVVGIEHISSAEDLVTLKAISNMGVVPDIAEEKIPESARRSVLQAAQNLVDTAYRTGPESVIDRCRDLAAAALGAHFAMTYPQADHKDLGDLATLAQKEQRSLIENAARLIARLHARGKPNEQARRKMSAPTDEDASLALECAGLILRELGWVHP